MGQELTDARVLVNEGGFFVRKLLGSIWINPPTHPTCCPHQFVLRLSATHDGRGVYRDPPREVVVDKRSHISVLHYHILAGITYITCSLLVSIYHREELGE